MLMAQGPEADLVCPEFSTTLSTIVDKRPLLLPTERSMDARGMPRVVTCPYRKDRPLRSGPWNKNQSADPSPIVR